MRPPTAGPGAGCSVGCTIVRRGFHAQSGGRENHDLDKTRILVFPDDVVLGTLDWVGRQGPLTSPIEAAVPYRPTLATGRVPVPAGVPIDFDVRLIEVATETPDGVMLVGSREPVDLKFLRDLPADAIESISLHQIVPGSIGNLIRLASGLRRLYLCDSELGDEALATVAQLRRLTYLQTWGNIFTDDACQQLAALQDLEILCLEEETLSAAALAFVRKLPRLRGLGLQDMPITDEQLAELRTSLPGVQVG